FGPFVYQQDNQCDFRVIAGDRIGNVLQEHRFAGAGWRNDQRALTFTDRGHQVQNTGGEVLRVSLETDLLIRVQRSEIVKEDSITRHLGRLEVYGLDLD